MIISKIKAILRPIKYSLKKHPDTFLGDISGVVHVGANTGQERDLYKHFGLHVIWIEPIPEVFTELMENIEEFHDQRAFQALITENDGEEYQFHISNNHGESSSILDLKQHRDIWPDVIFTTTISLNGITLNSLFQREQIDPGLYQALVMDTQGSELLVLQGSLPILENFKYIKIEVPNFEAYEGCCQLDDIDAFMAKNGFEELSRNEIASHSAGGSYFDIVYRKKL